MVTKKNFQRWLSECGKFCRDIEVYIAKTIATSSSSFSMFGYDYLGDKYIHEYNMKTKHLREPRFEPTTIAICATLCSN